MSIAAAVTGCLLAGLVAGCSSLPTGQPEDNPLNQLSQELNTPGLGARMNGDEATVRTPESAFAWIAGPRRTVIVRSVSMIALPGFRLPRLLGVGVMPGCTGSGSIQASVTASGSPQVEANGHLVRLLPATGYRMRTGLSSCSPTFDYTVMATNAGQYAAAGLRLRVLASGRIKTVLTYDGIFIWCYPSGQVPSAAQYQRRYDAASSAQYKSYTAQQAGLAGGAG
jgi:hypothetical protein